MDGKNRTGRYSQTASSTFSLGGIAPRGVVWVEGCVLVPVYRYIQHVGVFFKRGLNTVTLVKNSEWNAEVMTGMRRK